MTELKPCPFCGQRPVTGVDFYESCGGHSVKLQAVVTCTKCHVSRGVVFQATDINLIPFSDYENAFNKAIELWNERPE